ncbi:hypothetical protein BDK51DRAFT_25701 [Blyttiomyces helicus]|uniref:Uncharacterized protein n=1 Tax=Blyttiomyces helicus TaxID=388810 RepID=A0A4P9W6Q4_9FUNG|nr:hypothetical protein BDK51DRAFT_25701 [Blyttiomyces helicus]|eukprot:RKO87692.1 hypothetical protein BDK51DRAFT_25701 [Blyttiomyces helicus]
MSNLDAPVIVMSVVQSVWMVCWASQWVVKVQKKINIRFAFCEIRRRTSQLTGQMRQLLKASIESIRLSHDICHNFQQKRRMDSAVLIEKSGGGRHQSTRPPQDHVLMTAGPRGGSRRRTWLQSYFVGELSLTSEKVRLRANGNEEPGDRKMRISVNLHIMTKDCYRFLLSVPQVSYLKANRELRQIQVE